MDFIDQVLTGIPPQGKSRRGRRIRYRDGNNHGIRFDNSSIIESMPKLIALALRICDDAAQRTPGGRVMDVAT